MAQTEGAKFWLSVMNELKNRGVDDIFIACCDGLKGFPEAIEAVYPKTQVQLCIVHQIRHSLRYVNWKQRKTIAADLKLIYGAATRAEAEQALENFASTWDSEHPTISRSWRANWERLSVFFDYPVEIRKAIYTTNAIGSLNASLRKITKTRRSFPNDEAVMKVLYLALHQASKSGRCPYATGSQRWHSLRLYIRIGFNSATSHLHKIFYSLLSEGNAHELWSSQCSLYCSIVIRMLINSNSSDICWRENQVVRYRSSVCCYKPGIDMAS